MIKPNFAEWMTLSNDLYALNMDAAAVIWLRTMRIAAGGTRGSKEAQKMVAEKVTATINFAGMMASGQAGTSPEAMAGKAIHHYGKKVRANKLRLSRG